MPSSPAVDYNGYSFSASPSPELYQNNVVPVSSTVSTVNPYLYFYYTTTTTTARPEYKFVTKPTTLQPTYPPSFNRYSITSTKNPYDFKEFATRAIDRNDGKNLYAKEDSYFDRTTAKPSYEKGYDFHGRQTTKGAFDKNDYYHGRSTTKTYQDKGIRSLYKIGTYYQQLSKANDNSIRPDASQQVNIEPARLVYSYRRNLTAPEK